MTLFSLHHDSNFPGLVPPALWRHPGHCAGSWRGETERVTHPGKNEPLYGLRVLYMHMYTCTHKHKHTLSLSLCTWKDQFWIWECGRWLIETLFWFGLFCFWHKSLSPFTRGPLRPPYLSPHNAWRRRGLGKLFSNSTLLSSSLCLSIIDELRIKAAHPGCHFLSQAAFIEGRVGSDKVKSHPREATINNCLWYWCSSSPTSC